MPDSIRDRFSHNGFGMFGQTCIDNRQRTGVLHRSTELGGGELRDRVIQTLTQPSDSR
jgi:hypothetical protein